ncbi:oxaloacetate decarboxylase [Altererythrobacter sp. GH1-8]|uniref:isocitrate lyase/PEP mutase family protein n=1 Tax=Altererythrobacter sp. GH1-8 TaxID=3349333 RepID=UPI00374D9CAB
MTDFRPLLMRAEGVHAPGCYDALSAALIEQAGFEATYLSGASIAYTQLGKPDIGLVSMSEVADVLMRIRDRIGLAIAVDADTGFGNALNVERTVRTFERAGANAIQLEDQTLPKRCGHLTGKTLVSSGEMVGKIKAALDTRQSEATLIIARTDAIAVEGFAAALDRAEAYLEAGADVLFVEAPSSLEEMKQVCARFGGRVPLLANMVEGGATPVKTRNELLELGYRLIISPGALVRAITPVMEALLAELCETGSSHAWQERMLDLSQLNQRLELKEILAQAESYADCE